MDVTGYEPNTWTRIPLTAWTASVDDMARRDTRPYSRGQSENGPGARANNRALGRWNIMALAARMGVSTRPSRSGFSPIKLRIDLKWPSSFFKEGSNSDWLRDLIGDFKRGALESNLGSSTTKLILLRLSVSLSMLEEIHDDPVFPVGILGVVELNLNITGGRRRANRERVQSEEEPIRVSIEDHLGGSIQFGQDLGSIWMELRVRMGEP
ncbi:hypothetical protein TCAL_15368 [Tigriopus californicus]|uniref:Uncharacterized protein n=1 Tax=Tigriopus californicus TaxID=6832 RepID=A0A553PMK1_TIGCA|nr:hypothetical protein TCAL_15368 [Tigriopus californicus]